MSAIHDFKTLVVLEFSSSAKKEAVEWLVERIRSSKIRDGLDLDAEVVIDEESKDVIVHISGSVLRLLETAEMIEMKKEYTDGTMREFDMEELELFKGADDVETFLTTAEKQRLILDELENLRIHQEGQHVPGYDEMNFYAEEAIVPRLIHEEIICQLFPLHESQDIQVMGKEWYGSLHALIHNQPVELIKNYFGGTVAMYFAFLGHYTRCLILPSIISILYLALGIESMFKQISFAVFNLLWVTIFLERWKRKSAEFAYQWGSIDYKSFEKPRAAFHGEMGVNEVTGKHEPQYSETARLKTMYLCSAPAIAVSLVFNIVVALVYIWLDDFLGAKAEQVENTILKHFLEYVPNTAFGFFISFLNGFYRNLAKILTDKENHRLQSMYDNHLTMKLVLFEFFNSFTSLFYIAFYLQDMQTLKQTLAALLITEQIMGQIQETLIPFLTIKYETQFKNLAKGGISGIIKVNLPDVGKRLVSQETGKQAEFERKMIPTEGVFDEYLEMFIQFGYVFLFSSVFPTAAVWALANNIIEIRVDAVKVCKMYQRPFAQPSSGIGAWQMAFEAIGVLAVITNFALMAMSPAVQEVFSHWGPIKTLLFFVVAEHVVLALKKVIDALIPDVPRWVQTAMAKQEYESKQAWRKQRAATMKRKRAHVRRISVANVGLTGLSMDRGEHDD